MSNKFAGLIQFKTQEQKQIALMLCTGFFMGVFIATYQVIADSLFLNRLGLYLNRAFLIAGALGILSTALFSTFQNKIKFTTLTLISVLLIFVFTTTVHLLLRLGKPEWDDFLVFTIYCMSGPITAVLLLCFWGLFGRLFNFRQSKRIIGWIDAGQLIAAIMASFLIPFTSKLVTRIENYLVLCSISILVVSLLFILISTSFKMSKNDPEEFGYSVQHETKWGRLLRDPYILLLSMFLMVSMTTYVFNQYSFQQLVKEQYPSERDMTNFNAFFTGAVYGLSLLMQTFVNNKIISNYGLRISLFMLPIIVGFFALGSVITGGLLGFDKVTSSLGFIYFFLFIALSRMFNWTLRDSLENPVYKLFFIPLDTKVRFNIQSKVEGLVNESSRFLAGLLIFTFSFFPFIRILHISILVIVLAGAYFLIVIKMYAGYRSKISQKLENSDFYQEKLEKGFAQITSKLEQMLSLPSSAKAVFSFKLLEKINSALTSTWVNSLMKNDDEAIRNYAQEKMNELKGLSVSDKYVINLDRSKVNDEERTILSAADIQLIIENGGDITKSRIQKLSRSSTPRDRQYAAELLLHTSKNEYMSYLMELLNDPEPLVRNTAIKTAVKRYNTEVINVLIDNLLHPAFSNQAMNTLILIGAPTLPSLDTAFFRNSNNTQVILKIIQIMGRIGGQRVRELLWSKIDYPNKMVVSQALLSLGECGFKAGISQITRIKYAIESDIADIRWNLSAILEIGDAGFSEQIKNSLRDEIQSDIEHFYTLLAMLYDTHSIQLVKENIESGTPEGITYAIELLDVFLSEQLKQRVIPVLDDLSEEERVRRLDDFFPRVRLDSKLVLKFIINRDFSQSNRWTKACVLYQIGILKIKDFKLDLIAQLFNPDPLLYEVSAWALYQINKNLYIQNAKRLPDKVRLSLDEVILNAERMMRTDKVLFFQKISVFESIPGITLSYLADISYEIFLNPGESLTLDEKSNNNFYILVKGTVDFYQQGEKISEFSSGQFIGEMLQLPNFVNTNLLFAQSHAVILKFNKEQFYELLSRNVKLADKVMEFIQTEEVSHS